jgi:uncharacterized membrane protein YqjE
MADQNVSFPPDPTGSAAGAGQSPSAGELVSRVAEQLSTLVRDELRLAQAELTSKGKKAGLGAGLFGQALLFGWLGAATLVAAAVLGLANAVPAWLAAVIVGVILLVLAGVGALMGKKQVAKVGSPLPQEAVAGMRRDLDTLKESAKR